MDKNIEKLTDKTIMPFGMFKGKPLALVEDSWLRWFYEQKIFKKNLTGFNLQLIGYINDNRETIFKK